MVNNTLCASKKGITLYTHFMLCVKAYVIVKLCLPFLMAKQENELVYFLEKVIAQVYDPILHLIYISKYPISNNGNLRFTYTEKINAA